MNVTAPFVLAYSFDYGQFDSSEMQGRAKSTLGNFLSFVRSSFDGLLENGRALQELYCDCLALCANGKKVFDDWLASPDFGVSRYLARSAMEIYVWFEKLPERIQRLVRQNVQSWSVSALRQLTKVSADLVKELTCTGKKTAAQVKQHVSKQAGISSTPVSQSPAPQLAPGMRKRIQVTLPDRLAEDLEKWANYDGRPLSNLAAYLLERAVAEAKKRRRRMGKARPQNLANKTNK